MEIITTQQDQLAEAGFAWRESAEGLRALVNERLESDGFVSAFSTRAGGVSPFPQDDLNLAGFDEDSAANIHENRRRFFELLGGNWTLAACWQVHGDDVYVVRKANEPRSDKEHCDSLITQERGVLLGVKTADCVPVLLADKSNGACAAVHAGWRGTLKETVKQALARMRREFGTDPANVRVAIGPAALGCCYEVGADVIDAFRDKFNYADDIFTPTVEGHAIVDLQRANREQLVECGVSGDRIDALPLCTMCRTDLFFSYRREKVLYGRTGRLLSVIGRRQ
jgi:YfiH family protein